MSERVIDLQFNKSLKHRLIVDNKLESVDRLIRNITHKSLRKECFMNSLLGTDSVQQLMIKSCNADSPFSLIRFGLYEGHVCHEYLEKLCGIRKKYSQYIKDHISMDAGMFSNDEDGVDQYANLIFSLLQYADYMAYWSNIPRHLVFNDYLLNVKENINVEDLYPYPFWHNRNLPTWQQALTGKDVLIVSSFSKSIEKQYQKRENIWDDNSILPEFNLITYQALQTSGGAKDKRFKTWRDAYDFMLNEIMQINFDVALISCGGYGMPLALELKMNGKKAIQWGGCFQLWFGINGARWSNNAEINQYVNENWTYPMKEETPPLFYNVDHGSYWAGQE